MFRILNPGQQNLSLFILTSVHACQLGKQESPGQDGKRWLFLSNSPSCITQAHAKPMPSTKHALHNPSDAFTIPSETLPVEPRNNNLEWWLDMSDDCFRPHWIEEGSQAKSTSLCFGHSSSVMRWDSWGSRQGRAAVKRLWEPSLLLAKEHYCQERPALACQARCSFSCSAEELPGWTPSTSSCSSRDSGVLFGRVSHRTREQDMWKCSHCFHCKCF